MGALNAMGWVLCVSAAEGPDEVWDLLNEFGERTGTDGPTVHAMARDSGQPRYCVHPDSTPEVEFRHDDLREALLLGAVWKAERMDAAEMWRRDG
jgi:hypothetical protein